MFTQGNEKNVRAESGEEGELEDIEQGIQGVQGDEPEADEAHLQAVRARLPGAEREEGVRDRARPLRELPEADLGLHDLLQRKVDLHAGPAHPGGHRGGAPQEHHPQGHQARKLRVLQGREEHRADRLRPRNLDLQEEGRAQEQLRGNAEVRPPRRARGDLADLQGRYRKHRVLPALPAQEEAPVDQSQDYPARSQEEGNKQA